MSQNIYILHFVHKSVHACVHLRCTSFTDVTERCFVCVLLTYFLEATCVSHAPLQASETPSCLEASFGSCHTPKCHLLSL